MIDTIFSKIFSTDLFYNICYNISTYIRVDLTATGSFIMGTAANPIGSSYNAKLIFVYPGATKDGFTTVDGATVSFYGSSSYYGGTYKATLKANWTTGQSFTVDGDMSGWPVDSEVCLHKGAL